VEAIQTKKDEEIRKIRVSKKKKRADRKTLSTPISSCTNKSQKVTRSSSLLNITAKMKFLKVAKSHKERVFCFYYFQS